jgi:hypothetical protein
MGKRKKNCPKSNPTHTSFCQNLNICTVTVSVKISKIWTIYQCSFQKLPKVNNGPMGENVPNLVTLDRPAGGGHLMPVTTFIITTSAFLFF